MDQETQTRAGELKRLAAKVGPLKLDKRQLDAKNKLLENAASGDWAVYGPNEDENDARNDAKSNDVWELERQVPARLLAWLCEDERAKKCIHPHGIQVYGAEIIGSLDLRHDSFPFPLSLCHCRLKEGIDLRGAEAAQLDFEGSLLHGVQAAGCVVKHNLCLWKAFTAVGEVDLTGAQVGQDLDCTAGTFRNEGGRAIVGEEIKVGGSILLRDGFTAIGEVRLLAAQVGHNIECDGGAFSNESDVALNAAGINVDGNVFLKSGKNAQGQETRFSARGAVKLDLAEIDGQLDCSGGRFSSPYGTALSAFRAVVKSSVFLRHGFDAEGGVDLSGAQINRRLDLAEGVFDKTTLDLTDTVAGVLNDSGLNDPIEDARSNSLEPSGLGQNVPAGPSATRWPKQGKLLLDGFVYGRISSDGRIDADRRISKWLALQSQPPFRTQPYLQLAKVLTEAGDDKGAKRVLVEMEDQLRKGDLSGRVLRPLLRWTIGYGYDPLRSVWWAAGLATVGWIIYRRSYLAGGMVPTDKDAYAHFMKSQRNFSSDYAHYPSFFPLVYSIENSLPLVKLGQDDKWQPDPEAHRLKGPTDRGIDPATAAASDPAQPWTNQKKERSTSRRRISPRLVTWFRWIQILLGWLLATLVVAGVSGVVRKQ